LTIGNWRLAQWDVDRVHIYAMMVVERSQRSNARLAVSWTACVCPIRKVVAELRARVTVDVNARELQSSIQEDSRLGFHSW
jgi:hypothetical protein